jgi:hypothetical protein
MPVFKPDPPLAERFWPKVNRRGDDECWPWGGSIDGHGYGRIMVRYKPLKAHRIAYELVVGKIPAGTELDHLCRNRSCVNPSHLEAVPHRQNVMRGLSPTAANAMKTECKHGHPFDLFNTYYEESNGQRHCRECDRIRHQLARRAKWNSL